MPELIRAICIGGIILTLGLPTLRAAVERLEHAATHSVPPFPRRRTHRSHNHPSTHQPNHHATPYDWSQES